MNTKEFLRKNEKEFWTVRKDGLKKLAERYEKIYSRQWGHIEKNWKDDFFDWVITDSVFLEFSEKEQEKIKGELQHKNMYVIDKVKELLK